MKELLEEVNSLGKDKDDAQLNCLVPTEQVEQSLKLLADLKLEETLGEEVVQKISDPEGAQIKQYPILYTLVMGKVNYFRKLLSQLEQFKNKINEKPEAETNATEDSIIYQFKYRPEQAKLQQTARVAELESRLHKLESVLGASSDKLSRLTTATNKGK